MSGDDSFSYRVETRSGYVFVWQGGTASDMAQVERMQAEVEAAMAEVGSRCVMFDNRDTGRPDEYVRATMWTWVSTKVQRAAMLQAEVKNIKRAEKRGEQNRVRVRAFTSESEAEGWLLVPKSG